MFSIFCLSCAASACCGNYITSPCMRIPLLIGCISSQSVLDAQKNIQLCSLVSRKAFSVPHEDPLNITHFSHPGSCSALFSLVLCWYSLSPASENKRLKVFLYLRNLRHWHRQNDVLDLGRLNEFFHDLQPSLTETKTSSNPFDFGTSTVMCSTIGVEMRSWRMVWASSASPSIWDVTVVCPRSASFCCSFTMHRLVGTVVKGTCDSHGD